MGMQKRDPAKWPLHGAPSQERAKGGTQLRHRIVAIIAFNVHCVMGVCGAVMDVSAERLAQAAGFVGLRQGLALASFAPFIQRDASSWVLMLFMRSSGRRSSFTSLIVFSDRGK